MKTKCTVKIVSDVYGTEEFESPSFKDAQARFRRVRRDSIRQQAKDHIYRVVILEIESFDLED